VTDELVAVTRREPLAIGLRATGLVETCRRHLAKRHIGSGIACEPALTVIGRRARTVGTIAGPPTFFDAGAIGRDAALPCGRTSDAQACGHVRAVAGGIFAQALRTDADIVHSDGPSATRRALKRGGIQLEAIGAHAGAFNFDLVRSTRVINGRQTTASAKEAYAENL